MERQQPTLTKENIVEDLSKLDGTLFEILKDSEPHSSKCPQQTTFVVKLFLDERLTADATPTAR
jgi:hypothetical protein